MTETTTSLSASALHIEADWPIERKIRFLQDFLFNHFFDENGLMYCMWKWTETELRPFRHSDFEGYSYPSSSDGFGPEGHQNNENSSCYSAMFLWSQVERFKATGEEQALDYAAKAFRSLDRVFQLTEAAGHRGYLCKPYHGRVSTQTSPDQYIFSLIPMWNYREIAPKETRERIDYLLPAMADWWREHNYRINFFDMDMSGCDSDPWHNPGMTALNMMAYLVTGDAKYQREAHRLIGLGGMMPTYYDLERRRLLENGSVYQDWYLDGYLADESRKHQTLVDCESRGAVAMAVWPLPFLFEHDFARAPLFRHALARYWRHMQYGLRDDMLSYYTIQVDLERDAWHTCNVPPTPESVAKPAYNWHFCAYYSEVCWGDSVARIPIVSAIAHKYAGDFCPGALALAKKVLTRLDDTRLQWMIDPDGQQLLPPDRWMDKCTGEMLIDACLGYWYARAQGVEL
ncbi:MAG: hypothetical protein ACYDCO_05860 [Armatimonadota bacterium]